MFKAKCIKAIPLEYITAGEEYVCTVWEDGCVEYKNAQGAGSWVRKGDWDKAIKDGQIVVL